MSAKRKDSKPLRKPSGRPSDSSADGGKGSKPLDSTEWDFSELLNDYRNAGRKPDSPAGQVVTAAALYEYARESGWFRKLCEELATLETKLVTKYGKNWETQGHEGWEAKIVGEDSPIHPSAFDPLRRRQLELCGTFEKLEKRMAAGCVLLRLPKSYLAENVPWLRIPQEDRATVIDKAWAEEQDKPRWISEIEKNEPAKRYVRRGEHPPFLSRCGPAPPRKMFRLARLDREDEERWRQAEREGKVTQGEWSDRVNEECCDLVEGKCRRDENPWGQETIAFELNWSLSNEEMVAEFRGMLERWRPEQWLNFAKSRAANVQVDAALVNLAALRFTDEVKASNTPGETRAAFWKRMAPRKKEKENMGSEESKFSQAKSAAIGRLHAWRLLTCQAAGI